MGKALCAAACVLAVMALLFLSTLVVFVGGLRAQKTHLTCASDVSSTPPPTYIVGHVQSLSCTRQSWLTCALRESLARSATRAHACCYIPMARAPSTVNFTLGGSQKARYVGLARSFPKFYVWLTKESLRWDGSFFPLFSIFSDGSQKGLCWNGSCLLSKFCAQVAHKRSATLA